MSEEHCQRSPHSGVDYFKTILSKLYRPPPTLNIHRNRQRIFVNELAKGARANHGSYLPSVLPYKDKGVDVILFGYFQRYDFVPTRFRDMLTLPVVDDTAVRDTCFLHIRGGDYVGHGLHDVKPAEYYRKSIAHMKSLGITKFSIFTNDKAYAASQEFLKDIDHHFVDAPELESLVLMSKCRAGITANSTFSWWGAYLNPDRPICMPSKWFTDREYDISGYFFPGVFIISVD
jgi:hypothetical protein